MIKIIIADDHAIVRKGLVQILADYPGRVEIDEVENGEELLAMIKKKKYNLILMDITMSGKSGLEVLKDSAVKKSRIPVLILSMHPEEHYALKAFKSGASGYLTKKAAPEKLVYAITKILEGGRFVSEEFTEKIINSLGDNPGNPGHELLSDREYQVMLKIASGMTIGDIAESMNLKLSTVSTYRQRILEKMKLKNKSEIIRYVIENNLLE